MLKSPFEKPGFSLKKFDLSPKKITNSPQNVVPQYVFKNHAQGSLKRVPQKLFLKSTLEA